MTNLNLVNTILKILRQPGVLKIAFELRGLVVTGQRFMLVAKAIEESKISCKVVDKFTQSPGQKLAPGMVTEARYDPDADAMIFPREDYGKSNAYERTVIIHEATHAIFDLFAKTNEDRVLGIDDESAAVLAQALYIRLCDGAAAAHRFSMFIGGPGDLALQIVDQMISETGNFEKDKRTYFLKPNQIEKFRLAVAKDWNMIKDEESDRTGQLSIYNGVVTCFSCWVQGM